VVKHCVGSYDTTTGKQCVYGWGYNYREGGTAFGCLSGNSCKHTPAPTPAPRTGCGAERPLRQPNLADRPGGAGVGVGHGGECSSVNNAEQCDVSWTRSASGENFSCNWSLDKMECEQTTNKCYEHRGEKTPLIEDFCKSSSEEQWDKCNKLPDKTSCTKYGDGCKWTSKSAFGGDEGRNNYPGCIVNCTGCNTISVGVNREEVDDCVYTDSEGACDSQYEVPEVGNTKLCIKGSGNRCDPGYGVDLTDDRFCTRQRYSLDCEEQDDDGFCYTTGDL